MKYGIIQHLKYLLNYSRTVIFLQLDLSHLPSEIDTYPYTIKEIDLNSNEDIELWLDVVNNSYDDIKYNFSEAKEHLSKHHFLKFNKIFLLKEGKIPIATYGIGTYKNNPSIGGSNRLAVRKEYQGKGIGRLIFLYGLNKFKEIDIKYVEHIISIPRTASILLHFKCGFIPQYNRKYVQYKKQKRFFVIRLLVNYKLKKIYKKYIDSLGSDFLKK